jgi:rubrerythrin
MKVPSPLPAGADFDQAIANADYAVYIAETLQDLEDAGWKLDHLEDRNTFSLYNLGCGMTFWACPDCGSIAADPIEGCEACGYRTADDEVTA